MPVSSAAKLASHLWRGAAQSAASAAHNTGSTFRGAFHGATNGSGSSTSSASGWASGLSSGGSAGTGAGGAKYHAGRGAHSTFQQSSRSLSQATTTSSDSNDGKTNDDDEEARLQHLLPLRLTSPTRQGRGLFLQTGNVSRAQMQARFAQTFAPHNTPHFLEPTDATSSSTSDFRPTPAIAEQPTDPETVDEDALSIQVPGPLSPAHFHSRNMLFAGRRGDAQGVRDSIAAIRTLPASKQSTTDFNNMIQALRSVRKKGQPIGEIVDIYSEMIEAGHLPDQHTYAMLVHTLCERDVELNKDSSLVEKDQDHYGRALELMDVAHKSNFKFPYQRAYNSVLHSCALRGDVDTALSVLDTLVQPSNPDTHVNAETYSFLIQTIVKDPRTKEGESTEMLTARKLEACRHVLQEYRAAVRPMKHFHRQDNIVWAALIEAHFTLGDSAGAVANFEKVLERDRDVPRLEIQLVSTMLKGFLSLGDTATALDWFLRFTRPETSIPLPYTKQMEDLAIAVSRSGEHLEQLPSILHHYLQKLARTMAEPQLLPLIEAVSACVRKVDTLVDAGKAKEASFTLDLVLTIMSSFFSSAKPTTLSLIAKNQADQAASAVMAIFSVAEKLLDSHRFADAGSALTYAGVFPQLFDASTSDGERLAGHLQTVAGRLFGVGHPVVSASLQLLASAEYAAPLLKDTGLLNEDFASGLCSLYRQSRSESPDVVTDLPLTTSAWKLILDAFCFEESNLRPLDTNSFKTDSIPSVLHDLSKLSALGRDSLDVSQPVAVTIARHGEEALDLLPTWAVEAHRAQQDSLAPPASPETQSEAGQSSIDTASTAPTSQGRSPLHRQDLPATTLPASSDHTYAPVQTIDTDLGPTWRATSKHRSDYDRTYESLLKKAKDGIFPDPRALSSLMVTFARFGDARKVYEVHAMTQHVLRSLEEDPAWYTSEWYGVENNTIQALCIIDQPELAMIHRHRIIAAGGAPSASAYASLITTTRDTTDDATIAQELFEESQRLQVNPNVYLYNTVISKLSRARKADLVLQLFYQMRASDIRPNSVTYGAVINACIRIGDERNAVKLFHLMETQPKFEPRVPPYNTMMQYYIQSAPDRESAYKYYVKMQQAGVAPSSHTYKLLLDMYGTIEPVDVDRMENTFAKLAADPSVAVQGTHWASLINSYGCVLNDLDRAVATFADIATHPSTQKSKAALPDAVAFESLLTVFLAHQRVDLMRQYVAKMQESGIHMTAYVVNLLIRGYSLEGEKGLQEARDLFENMEQPAAGVAAAGNHPPRAHGAGAPASADAFDQARMPADTADGRALTRAQREPSTYESMIRAELEHGSRDRAVAVLEQMEARAFPPAVIVRAYSLIGDADLAGLDPVPWHVPSAISFAPKSPVFTSPIPAASRAYSTSVRHASTMADVDSGLGTSNPAPGPPKPNSPFTIFDRAVKTVQKDRAAARPASAEAGAETTRGEASRQTDYVRHAIAESLAERVLDIKRDFATIVELGAGPGLLRHYLKEGKGTKKIVMCDTSESLLYRDTHLDENYPFEFERHVIDEEKLPFEEGSLDCIVVSGGLHWTNDLPGALIQIRRALKPDGVFIGALSGGDTLFELRTSLQLAEQEREGGISPRVSPMADTRDMASLLSRAGFTIPTVDVDEVMIGFPSMYELMHDLRDMGESNAVIHRRGFLRRDTMLAASAIYESMHGLKEEALADSGMPAEGVPATFQLIFLIGWSPAPTQPKPLKRGSASTNLKDVLAGEEGDVQAQAEAAAQAPEEENKQLGQMLNSLKNHDDKKK